MYYIISYKECYEDRHSLGHALLTYLLFNCEFLTVLGRFCTPAHRRHAVSCDEEEKVYCFITFYTFLHQNCMCSWTKMVNPHSPEIFIIIILRTVGGPLPYFNKKDY
jgi:hypothetical protein